MKADYSSHNNALAFPLSLEEAASPEVEGPTRFARALKRARFARGWTQANLSAQLAIPKRSIVSWETGERIPSVGMVLLLLDALFPGEELSLHRELFTAYIVDDLERQEQRRDAQRDQDDPLRQHVQRVLMQMAQLPTSARSAQSEASQEEATATADEQGEQREPSPQKMRGDEQHALEPLFALMAQLRQHPELIPVVGDFVRELAPNEEDGA
jgi:transcriptional regulator with XRE-family HTH domain